MLPRPCAVATRGGWNVVKHDLKWRMCASGTRRNESGNVDRGMRRWNVRKGVDSCGLCRSSNERGETDKSELRLLGESSYGCGANVRLRAGRGVRKVDGGVERRVAGRRGQYGRRSNENSYARVGRGGVSRSEDSG